MISEEKTSAPAVNGLVLAGGLSTRMGRDKSTIRWHGKEQRYHLADLLQALCEKVYISCRPEQAHQIDSHYAPLPDAYTGLGPTGGIRTALEINRNSAWLVVACDLPLLNAHTLAFLVSHRNPASVATTFKSPHDNLPEPLITIWEPRSHAVLMEFLEKWIRCPRKMLINSHITVLDPPDPNALLNANIPGEAEAAERMMKGEK